MNLYKSNSYISYYVFVHQFVPHSEQRQAIFRGQNAPRERHSPTLHRHIPGGADRAAPAEREAGPIISVFASPVDSAAPFSEAPIESEGATQIAAPRGKTPNAAPWRGVIKDEQPISIVLPREG